MFLLYNLYWCIFPSSEHIGETHPDFSHCILHTNRGICSLISVPVCCAHFSPCVCVNMLHFHYVYELARYVTGYEFCVVCSTSYKLFIATVTVRPEGGLYLQRSNKWPPFYYSLNWSVVVANSRIFI